MIEKNVEFLKITVGYLDTEERMCGLCVNYGQFAEDMYKIMDSEVLQCLLTYAGSKSLKEYFSDNVHDLLAEVLDKKGGFSDRFYLRLGEAVCDFELSFPNQDSDLSKEEKKILEDVDVILRYFRVRM